MIVWFAAAILTAFVLLYTLAPLARMGKVRTAYALSTFVALLSLALYAWLGNPNLPPQPAGPRQAAQQAALAQIEAGADKLRQSLAANPDDAAGWALLASSETALSHDEAAAIAFDHAAALTDGEEKETFAQQANAARLAERYKAGKAAWLAGDRKGMEANWRPLLDLLPDGAPLRGELLQKLDAPQ